MARITVEDCLKKISSQYDLVLLAKERTSQLNAGDQSQVPIDNDKNTVVSLREIGESKISIKTLEESAINKLRKKQEETEELEDLDEEGEDDFAKIYKGEISKSGAAILPSKRIRRVPEKIDLNEDKNKDDDNAEGKEVKVDEDLLSSNSKKEEDPKA
tara:strand:+ start:26 stop:499 length:474 start_codon:yes stop_codon:yes gene_type:complete